MALRNLVINCKGVDASVGVGVAVGACTDELSMRVGMGMSECFIAVYDENLR